MLHERGVKHCFVPCTARKINITTSRFYSGQHSKHAEFLSPEALIFIAPSSSNLPFPTDFKHLYVCFFTRFPSLPTHVFTLKQANRCKRNGQCFFYDKNEIEQLVINVSAISESCAQLRQPPNTIPHCEKRPLN